MGFLIMKQEYSKLEYSVNAINVKKADRKTISATNIQAIDNTFYTSSTVTKFKTAPLIIKYINLSNIDSAIYNNVEWKLL